MQTPEEVKKLLKQYGLAPNKTFGQNFLLDRQVLENIVQAANVKADDLVLEVGPGIGNLTELLTEKAGFVLSVEKDENFRPLLTRLTKTHKNLEIAYADVLDFDFVSALTKLAKGKDIQSLEYKVVANLPYYLTGAAFQLFLRSTSVKPRSITVLIQKEVAENIVASPGKTNLLSLSVQLLGVPSIVQVVPGSSFFPAPKVASCVVHIEVPTKPLFPMKVDEKMFFRVARACFSGKRKQIHNSLAAGFNFGQKQVLDILEKATIPADERPQRLAVEDFIRLTEAVQAISG